MTRRLITRGAQISASRRRGQRPQLYYPCHGEYVINRTNNINSSQDIPEEQRDIIILVNHHNKILMPGPIIQTTTRHSDQHSGTAVKHALSTINYQPGGPHTSSQLARQRLRPVTGAPEISLRQRLHQTSPNNQAHIT